MNRLSIDTFAKIAFLQLQRFHCITIWISKSVFLLLLSFPVLTIRSIFPICARMRNSPKITVALVACFAVTIISGLLKFSSSSTTDTVEVPSGTALQIIISAPSTALTSGEYTLMAHGATPTNTVSFTAAVNYPQMITITYYQILCLLFCTKS